MQTFEYRLLTLVAEGKKEHCYAWHCSVCGRLGDFDCLAEYLNKYGEDGWHVAAHVSDGRFGNRIVLQRPIVEEAPEKETVLVQTAPSPTPDSGGMLAASLDAYTSALQAQLQKRDQEFAVLLELLSQQLQGGFQHALNSVSATLEKPVTVSVKTTLDDAAFRSTLRQLVDRLQPDAKPTVVRQNFFLQLFSRLRPSMVRA